MTKLTDKNRFSMAHPDLCKEWDYAENYPLKPEDVSYGSKKQIAWICKKCHKKWSATLSDRHFKKSGCPHCTPHSNASVELNSLAILNPELAKEWHPTKNGELTPRKVSYKSSLKAWWMCKKGHEWNAKIQNRSFGAGCPYCSGKMVTKENSLLTKSVFLSKEWDYEKNYPLSPEDVCFGSHKYAWWMCSVCGNSWKAQIKSRYGGCNCPACRKIILKDGSVCDSVIEAFYYLKLLGKNIKFIHHGIYGKKMGKCTYDFYIPLQNKYMEITCYDKRFKHWFRYLRKIVKKKRYVENVLGANFEFIQRSLNSTESAMVRNNRLIS